MDAGLNGLRGHHVLRKKEQERRPEREPAPTQVRLIMAGTVGDRMLQLENVTLRIV